MRIKNSTLNDINSIFKLYKIASDYQKAKETVVVWPDFERELVENEIIQNRQFKLTIDGEIACVWAVAFKDDQIWENSKNDKAIYIHRIATNPEFRGQEFVTKIVNWAKIYAAKNEVDFIRLDTVGHNTKLISYYEKAGFNFLGMFTLNNSKGLPDHYHNQPAALFQIEVNK